MAAALQRRIEIFPIFGIVCLLGLLPLGFLASNRDAILRNRHADVYPVVLVAGVWLLVTGIGLLRASRWGAVMLCVTVASFDAACFGNPWIALGFAPLVIVPVYLTIRFWRLLNAR
jgi:hypothetical protein